MSIIIPEPTGRFGIGKSLHHLIDTTREERYGPGKRELLIYLYYPTHKKSTSPYAAGIMPIMEQSLQQAFRARAEDLAYLNSVQEHTQLNAPLAHSEQKFPVLFFSPGLSDPVETYTALLEEVASHGYVVVAINPPYGVDPTVFPDGKVIRVNKELAGFWYVTDRSFEDVIDEEHEYWAQDVHYVIDAIKVIKPTDSYAFLADKLDYDAMGYFGHSLGGSIALQMCRERSDLRACADLDGILFGPRAKRYQLFDAPSMFITAGQQVTDAQLVEHKIPRARYDQLIVPRVPRLLYDQLQSESYFITIQGANHNSFTDLDLLQKPLKKFDTDPVEIIEETRIMLVHFFDHSLKGTRFEPHTFTSLPGVTFEANQL